MKLIIMGCSATKRPETTPMTALERYDGPMWRTLRAQLDRSPAAAAALASGVLRIWVLSGLYGFIPANVGEVPDYDRRITPDILAKMARDCSYDFQRIAGMVEDAEAVLFAGGEIYRNAMWRASGGRLSQIMKIDETDGPGIGVHRSQLRDWFQTHFPEPEALAA